MIKKAPFIIILVAILFGLLTSAFRMPDLLPDPEPTPPPTPTADCSPGFWKNHTELWVDLPNLNPELFLVKLAMLQGGKDTRISRFLIAAWLNSQFPAGICED